MDPDPNYLWKLIKESNVPKSKDPSDKIYEKENKETIGKIRKELGRYKNKKYMLENHRPGDDKDSFLHLVARFHTKSTEILQKLISMCPEMVLYTRSGMYEGQTALHLLISTNNVDGIQVFFDSLKWPEKKTDMELLNRLRYVPLHSKAVGSRFKDTIMMAQLPFSVAVLTFNKKMVDNLWGHGADATLKNELGDTCFHSLVRYAKTNPQMLQNVMEMIYHLFAKFSSVLPKHKITRMLLQENNEELTPLKLAASLGQVEIFTTLLKLGGVYSSREDNDGMCDIYQYDVTEIDPLAQDQFVDMQRTGCLGETSKSQPTLNDSLPMGTQSSKPKIYQRVCHYLKCDRQNRRATSVLELICTLNFKKAFPFIKVGVVKHVIKEKWKCYTWFFYIWAIVHVSFLIMLAISGWLRSKCIHCPSFDKTTSDECRQRNTDSPCCNLLGEVAGYTSCVLEIVYGVVLIFLEFNRWIYFKQRLHIKRFFHNGIYRITFVAFSLCLIVDSVWFLSSRDNNYFLVVALLSGMWLSTFFLRGFKKFSFFCYMFLKVLFGDFLRLLVFIAIQWLSFSTAFYVLFLTSDEQPKTFSTFQGTLMAMFKVMLGLDDLESLCSSAVVTMLYIIYVLLTYILLVNSLIAMMSLTCSFVSQDRHELWSLQRLSIVLHVESMLFPSWRHTTGSWETKDWSDHSTGTVEKIFRRVSDITSVQDAPIAVDNIMEAERQTGEQFENTSANNETYAQIFLKALKRTDDIGTSSFTSSKPAKPETERKKKKKRPSKVTGITEEEEQLRGTEDVDISNLTIQHVENARPTHNFEMPIPHPFALQEYEADHPSCDTTNDLIQQNTLLQDQPLRP